jgi:hypothetical protein
VPDGAFTVDGQDIEDVEVVFTDRITRIGGRVTDERKRLVPGVVVVFAENRETWRSGVRYAEKAEVDTEGVYAVSALPPGRYLAVAVEDVEGLTPAVLDRLRRRATSVTLSEGERTTLDLVRVTP